MLLQEFEKQKREEFTNYLFWAIEAWSDALKGMHHTNPENQTSKQAVEVAFFRGYLMRLSQFSLIVQNNFKRLYTSSKAVEQNKVRDVHLNDFIKKIIDEHQGIFDVLEISFQLTTPTQEAVIWVEEEIAASPFVYLIWWLTDAWPDSQIKVDFIVQEKKVHLVFQDCILGQVYRRREYEENHKILPLWATLIEHLIVVEYHGRCIWPEEGETRRLEIILPVYPPTQAELDSPVSEWLQ